MLSVKGILIRHNMAITKPLPEKNVIRDMIDVVRWFYQEGHRDMDSPDILVKKIKKVLYDYEDRVLGEGYLDLRAVDGNKARELFKAKMEEEVFMPDLHYFRKEEA